MSAYILPPHNITSIEQRKADILAEFSTRIAQWYVDVKSEFEIDGLGECRFFEGDDKLPCGTSTYEFVVVYFENGIKYVAAQTVCDEYLIENKIDWLFNIWMEGGMPTKVYKGEFLTKEDIMRLYA